MTGPEETLGERVKRARKLRNLSQAQLAQQCKCGRGAIVKIETNQVNVGIYMLIEVAKVLDVSLDWIAFGSGRSEA